MLTCSSLIVGKTLVRTSSPVHRAPRWGWLWARGLSQLLGPWPCHFSNVIHLMRRALVVLCLSFVFSLNGALSMVRTQWWYCALSFLRVFHVQCVSNIRTLQMTCKPTNINVLQRCVGLGWAGFTVSPAPLERGPLGCSLRRSPP